MSDTPNHEYNVPSKGDQDWHVPLNENFEALEEDVEVRDQEANLSNYIPTQGAKFLATDTGVVYVGDGSTWNAQFIVAGYDDTAGEVQFSQPVAAPELDVGQMETTTLTVDGTPTVQLSSADGDGNNNTAGGNVIAGYEGNGVRNDAVGATVGGGGSSGTFPAGGNTGERDNTNEVTGNYGTVGGGRNNRASLESTVAGGRANTASGIVATVAGGFANTASSLESTIAGGTLNVASGDGATVSGGRGSTASGTVATVGGGEANTASGEGATISGGGANDATGDASTVSGGGENTAGARMTTVVGGKSNTANGEAAFVGGGTFNTASGVGSTVGGGGTGNEAYGDFSTIDGGENNRTGESGTEKGSHATVAGGQNNVAREDYSFAAGREAYARAEGSFVWGDSSENFVESLTQDEVVFQASGGVVMWTTNNNSVGAQLPDGDSSWTAASARAVKSDIDPVDPREVLAGVEDLEVSTWEYDTRRGVTHMGPMAGDFHDAFGLGDDEERINAIDADGVALAAIQGLSEKLDEKDERTRAQADRIDEQRDRIDDLETDFAERGDRISEQQERIEALEAENEALSDETDALREENEELRERLAAVEERLTSVDADGSAPTSADD